MFQTRSDFHSKFLSLNWKLCGLTLLSIVGLIDAFIDEGHLVSFCAILICFLFALVILSMDWSLSLSPARVLILFFLVLSLRLTSCIQLFDKIWLGSEFEAVVMCLHVLRSTWNTWNVRLTSNPNMFWVINILHPTKHKHFSSMALLLLPAVPAHSLEHATRTIDSHALTE